MVYSFATRAALYAARGVARKWGPWAARRWGGRAAAAIGGGAAAGYAGYAAKKYATGSKRGRTDSGTDMGGRPANDDTRTNLNSTYNSVSLYNKRSSKRRVKRTTAKTPRGRRRAYAKKIRKIVHTGQKWSRYSTTFSNALVITSAPATTFGSQDIFGRTYSQAFQFCAGGNNDVLDKDINHITLELKQWGHVENGAVVDDNLRNTDNIKFDYTGRMEFDIQCFNAEFTDTNPLYIDIYECTAARNINDVLYSTPADAWANTLVDTNQPFTGDGNPVITRKGARPSDAPGFSKWWGINKVTRVRISDASPFHYDMQSKGTWSSRLNQATGTHFSPYCVRGLTKGIIIVVAPIMVTTMPANYNFQITAVNKHFRFKQHIAEGHTPNQSVIASNFVTTI